jgi:hypothetical protein
MWLLTLFRKPLRAGSRKLLNLYGGKWAGQVFQKQVILLKKSVLEAIFLARLEAGVLRERSGGTPTNDGTNATD